MSFIDRIRRQHEKDRAIETKLRIVRNADQTISRADADRLEEERAPWLKRYRRRT